MNSASFLTQPISAEPSGVLPGQTKEVEAGHVGDASAVSEAPVRVENGEVDPGVIGPVPGCPDDCVDLQLAPVLEAHGPALSVDSAGFQLHAVPSPELPRARADQRLSSSQLPTEPRFDRRIEETALRQPPEKISAKQSLRERRLPRADGEDDPARGRELLGDWKPVLPPPTTSTVPAGTSDGLR